MNVRYVPLTFAHDKDAVLRHIDEVGNGLACGCICPACGSRLVAKQGKTTIHHFAHVGGSDCVGGVETALHLAAKKIISKERRMVLPSVEVQAEVKDLSGRSHTSKQSIPPKAVSFDKVCEEVPLDGIIPDIIAYAGNKMLLVEVAVNHYADEKKIALLQERGLAAVEIDLSGMIQGWTWEALTDAIVSNSSCKKWLFNPKSITMLSEATRLAKRIAAQADRDDKERAAYILMSHELQRTSIPGFRSARDQLSQFSSPENLITERARMNAEGPENEEWHTASKFLGIRWGNAPPYLNIEVKGEMGIPVDRRVWQAALFVKFVRGMNKTFDPKIVARWCLQSFGYRPEFSILQKNNHLLTQEEDASLPMASRAVYAYLKALEGFGFVIHKGTRYENVRSLKYLSVGRRSRSA